MNDFKVLDSIRLQYDLGIYDKWNTSGKYPEMPLFTIDETIIGVKYKFVKKGEIYYLIDKR